MSWFDSLFGGKNSNPANAAMPYLNQIPGLTNQFSLPFFQAGAGSLPGLQEQYGKLINDPSKRLNEIGAGYKESPGLNFAIQKALNSTNAQQNAQGMGGSPQNREYDTELATNYANQDYNNYLQQALGLYGGGLQGEAGLANMGQQSGQHMADTIAQLLSQQGNLAFRGQQENNSQRNSLFGGLGQLAGAGLGGLAGGPWGAFAGWNMGR
jgi:hypothetical protein